jgi:protein ImuA
MTGRAFACTVPNANRSAANRLDEDARDRLIGRLKGTIERIAADRPVLDPQAVEAGHAATGWCTGLEPLDARLPAGRLEPHGCHEIVAHTYGDAPAALGFAAALCTRRLISLKPQDRRPVLWVRALGEVSEYGRLYGHGLARFGLTHDRLLTVSLRKPQAVLWTIEEALRSRAVSMVVCDANHTRFDLTATRRAMLAAQEGETPCLMVFASPRDGATAARTRWHVSPAPSIPSPYDDTSPGDPAWHLTLTRSRGGRPGTWTVDWHHATHRFSLVSPSADRTVETGPHGEGAVEPAVVGARTVRAGHAGREGA